MKYLLDRVLGLAVLLAMSVAGALTFLRHEVSWAKSRERELRTLGMSPEEFVKRMERSKDRSPEVA